MARDWRNGSSRRRRNWDLDFRLTAVIARSEATKQSIFSAVATLDCFASLAMTRSRQRASTMHIITLDSETDFDGWRKAARALALNDVKPSDVTWNVRGRCARTVRSRRRRRSSRRMAPSTYRPNSSNWRRSRSCIATRSGSPCSIACCGGCGSHHDLLDIATDPDVAEVAAMAKAVRRDEHKMHAFVRFREVGREQKSHFVAWFEPEHHIVELAAPFFARRFADMPWSILTPDLCAHWDGHAVSITPGVSQVRGADRRPPGGNLAELLRQHLQPGAAEGGGDAERDAEEVLEEPAGGLVD